MSHPSKITPSFSSEAMLERALRRLAQAYPFPTVLTDDQQTENGPANRRLMDVRLLYWV